jgi:hypothetical protein
VQRLTPLLADAAWFFRRRRGDRWFVEDRRGVLRTRPRDVIATTGQRPSLSTQLSTQALENATLIDLNSVIPVRRRLRCV